MTTTRKIAARLTPAQRLQAAIDSFYARCTARNLSPHTLAFYKHRFEAFTRYLETEHLAVAPEEVTPALIRGFLASETKRVSAVTAEDSYVTLRAFFTYLVRDGQLAHSPMDQVEKVRQPRKVITTFTDEQLRALLATCSRDFCGKRDTAIFLMLTDCGLRVSELCGLRLADIDQGEHTLLVTGKGDKQRCVPFGQAVGRAVAAYLAHRGTLDTEAVFVSQFGTPLTRLRVLAMIKERGETAKLSPAVCTAHNFRRYFACAFLRAGGDVFSLQKLLGHTSLEMSRRYAELSNADVIAKHRQFSPGDALQASAPVTTGRRKIR